jgi:hypothetical protein
MPPNKHMQAALAKSTWDGDSMLLLQYVRRRIAISP